MVWYHHTTLYHTTLTPIHNQKDNMDELLALFAENPPEEAAGKSPPCLQRTTEGAVDGSSLRSDDQKAPEDEESTRRASLSSNVDQRVGFRITKRLVSSSDLLDMLSSHPFHTAASLAAMSLKQLNTLLVDPACVLDKATVAGKTNLMTSGIVFSNTGTRIASSGSGFTIVTIGSLRTGPSVSVMLFGSVYGKFCKKLVPGTAIAVLYPRIVPPKGDYSGDTSITLSLNDERQLVLLGTSQDFGFCKAKIRGKDERGMWVAEARRCRNYVDTSVCEYCRSHRSQASEKKKAIATHSTFQDLRRQDQFGMQTEYARKGRIITMPSQNLGQVSRLSSVAHSRGLFSASAPKASLSTGRGASIPISQPRSMLSIRGNLQSSEILNRGTRTISPKRGTPAARPKLESQEQPKNSLKNPYATEMKLNKSMPVVTPASHRDQNTKCVQTAGFESMITSRKRKKSAPLGPKPKIWHRINTDTVGFDGSVPVPKPKGMMASSSSHHAGINTSLHPNLHEKDPSTIIDRQREIAATLHSGESNARSRIKERIKKPRTHLHSLATTMTGWCAPIDDRERQRLRDVKSCFAGEADAELFAATRTRITELEKAEESKIRGKDGKVDENKQIRKKWQCSTCQQLYAYYPKKCHNGGHELTQVRELREETSQDQKRSELSNRATEEGGLKLGSGIEWSWSRFS